MSVAGLRSLSTLWLQWFIPCGNLGEMKLLDWRKKGVGCELVLVLSYGQPGFVGSREGDHFGIATLLYSRDDGGVLDGVVPKHRILRPRMAL